jgi:hypothetical protein
MVLSKRKNVVELSLGRFVLLSTWSALEIVTKLETLTQRTISVERIRHIGDLVRR